MRVRVRDTLLRLCSSRCFRKCLLSCAMRPVAAYEPATRMTRKYGETIASSFRRWYLKKKRRGAPCDERGEFSLMLSAQSQPSPFFVIVTTYKILSPSRFYHVSFLGQQVDPGAPGQGEAREADGMRPRPGADGRLLRVRCRAAAGDEVPVDHLRGTCPSVRHSVAGYHHVRIFHPRKEEGHV